MKVFELIEELLKCNSDADVMFNTADFDVNGYVGLVRVSVRKIVDCDDTVDID